MLKTPTQNVSSGLSLRPFTLSNTTQSECTTTNFMKTHSTFPVLLALLTLAVKDVPKFEKQNPSISVNILCSGYEGGFVPLHVSKERDRPHHVNLFLIEVPDESKHYVWVKNLSRLVRGRTKICIAVFVCNHCLHAFCKKDTLDRHIPHCQRHAPQYVKKPHPENPKECTLEFHNKAARFRLPFYLVCDFESFLTPSEHGEDVDATKKRPISLTNIECVALRVTELACTLNIRPTPLCTAGLGLWTRFTNMSCGKVM